MLGIRPPIWILVGFLLASALLVRRLADTPVDPSAVAREAVATTRTAAATSLAAPTEVTRSLPKPTMLEAEAAADEGARAEVVAPDARASNPATRSSEQADAYTEKALASDMARADSQLAVLEEEAARASLRRGLAAPASNAAPANSRNAEADRRALSDELVIDHLVAESYRTTGFAYDADAAGESRSEAEALLRGLSPAERKALLEESLADQGAHPAPLFGEPRQRADRNP
jgi:hypothetical protein